MITSARRLQDSRPVARTPLCHVGNQDLEDTSCGTCTSDLGVGRRCSRRDTTSCWDTSRADDIACLYRRYDKQQISRTSWFTDIRTIN